jgi:hypothetical protein
MNDSPLIKSHLKSLEAQVHMIEALVSRSEVERSSGGESFADLFGSLSGQAESSEEEIDAILYKSPLPPNGGGR